MEKCEKYYLESKTELKGVIEVMEAEAEYYREEQARMEREAQEARDAQAL